MKLKSSAFEEGQAIPRKFTCDGADVSPPLEWSGAPEATKSYVLIMDDPDAPGKTWVHWLYYDLAPAVTALPEAVPMDQRPKIGGRQGITDFRRVGYGGPCPPAGTHRYVFTLYALDTVLGLHAGAHRPELEAAMKGHVLEQARLVGTYSRA